MYLTRLPIVPKSACPDEFHSGAEVIFIGKVRNHSHGKKVLYLEYEAYEPMAENLIGELIQEAGERWKVDSVRLLHRLGKVGLGEAAVWIEVSSAHRDEAYQASRFLIEQIKHKVPIWKKEYFEDGTNVWSRCEHVSLPAASSGQDLR
jgi:molybdopterin synthase catalytic subunit